MKTEVRYVVEWAPSETQLYSPICEFPSLEKAKYHIGKAVAFDKAVGGGDMKYRIVRVATTREVVE